MKSLFDVAVAGSDLLVPDGAVMCDALDRRYEIVRPRWWRVDRWWVWMFGCNGCVDLTFVRAGRPYVVKVRIRSV